VTFRGDTPGNDLAGYLRNAGVEEMTLSETSPGIEDRFLELMEDTREE
jgi:hypothetical protein